MLGQKRVVLGLMPVSYTHLDVYKRQAKTESNRIQADLSELMKESDSLKALLNNQVNDDQTDRLPHLQAQHKEAVQRKDDLEQALVRAKIQVQDYEGQLEDLEERLAKAGNRNEDLIRQQTRLEERESQISQSLRKFATQLAEDYQMTCLLYTSRCV